MAGSAPRQGFGLNLAFEGDSHVEFFQGNYLEYEEDKKRRMRQRRSASVAVQGVEVIKMQ